MPTKRVWFLCLTLLASTWSTVAGAESDSYVLRAGRIMPVSTELPWELEQGMMIVRNGRLVAVGTDLELPADLPVIDLPDATVVPGFVSAASELGGAHHGDESIAAGYRALDAFDRYGPHTRSLAAGVTTTHVGTGTHRLLTGQGAVVKLGGDVTDCVLRGTADLVVNLGAPRPPLDVTYSFPASADVAIPMPLRQRPASRMGQFLALEIAVREAGEPADSDEARYHRRALRNAWEKKLPLRITAQRAADLTGSLEFLARTERGGYLVGGAEADRVADRIRHSGVPLVLQPADRFSAAGGDVGLDPTSLAPSRVDYGRLHDIRLALAPSDTASLTDLRLIAITASRSGLGQHRALEAITRVPAEILGVAQRVGSLDPGKDADFVVLSGKPLEMSTRVQRVCVKGQTVFEPPASSALVIKAATIWATPELQISDGEILIEDGRIVAVGRSVPHPRFARVIDVRADGFVAPGFIDGLGHLGLEGDKTAADNSIRFANLVGAADVTDMRVCRAGITTVMVAPYAVGSSGAPVSAIKTAGRKREDRVIDDPAAVLFDVSRVDPLAVAETLSRPLAAGKKYADAWAKYEKDLKEFLEKKREGEETEAEDRTKVEETKKTTKPDPVTGVWETVVRGTPIADELRITFELQLVNGNVHGRITKSTVGVTGTLTGTFDGKRLVGTVELNGVEVPGPVRIDVQLTGEDQFSGTVGAEGIVFPITGRRVDKSPVEISVTRRRLRGKDGRPLPPKVDPALEPLKTLLEKKIPAIVKASTPAQIREALDLLVGKHELPVTLLDAEGAPIHAARLAEEKVAVIVPPAVIRTRKHLDYLQADDLTRDGVSIAFQSNVEDGARYLPLVVLNAVANGLDADAALAGLTLNAARAYKIDDRVGSIEAGKDADIVIFNGHPFKEAGQVKKVIVCGQEVKQ